MKKYILNNQNIIYYNFIFILIFIIYTSYFFKSFHVILGDGWAYNNLFINYTAGFARRGLLGTIFLKLNNNYGIKPLHFFTIIFFSCYFLQLIIYYKLIYKYKKYKLFVTLLVLSPATILFNIYDLGVLMTQDAFINFAILLHALFFIKKKITIENYKFFLLLVLFPIITINILNHENQIFFLPFHLLFTLYFYKINQKNIKNLKLFYYYLYLLLPIIVVLTASGSFEKLTIINESIKSFNATIPNQFAGNINLAIGGFIKWHFFYHDISNFYRLFFCFLMSAFLFYIIFQNLINKQIITSDKLILKYYPFFMLPSIIIFLIVLDHGRSLHMMTVHFLAFYLIQKTKFFKFDAFYNNLKNNFFYRNFIYIFMFFYLFFWHLPQGGGYTGIGNFSSLFKSTLINEIYKLF